MGDVLGAREALSRVRYTRNLQASTVDLYTLPIDLELAANDLRAATEQVRLALSRNHSRPLFPDALLWHAAAQVAERMGDEAATAAATALAWHGFETCSHVDADRLRERAVELLARIIHEG
jgi:hypothetical protein